MRKRKTDMKHKGLLHSSIDASSIDNQLEYHKKGLEF